MGFEVHGMENFGSRTESPLQTCLNEVRSCKIFIAVLGMKCGSIDESLDKSFIEIEYDEAIENRQEILIYLIDEENALITPKFVDIDHNGKRLKVFKELLKKRHTISFFQTPTDLRVKVERDVKRLLLSRNLRTEAVRKVLKDGGVTITAAGDGSYYLGEKFLLSGTSLAENDNIFLFLTGPHLNPFGVKLDNISIHAISDNKGTFTTVEVAENNTWSYEWDTSKISEIRESGTYTIYAISEPKNKNDLSSGKYGTVSVILKNPFIAAALSQSIVARGDEFHFNGVAEGNPNNIYLWIFGKNYRLLQNPINVEKDGSFGFDFTRTMTKKFDPGQYFVILQHPMQNGRADIRTSIPGQTMNMFFKEPIEVGVGVSIVDITQMRASDAAEKLVEMLNLPDVDDIYTKLAFLVEEPVINIDPIRPKLIGEFFTITGTTNLNAGDELLIEFKPDIQQSEPIQQKKILSGFSGVCKITIGDNMNKWAFDIDGSTLVKGKYIIEVTSLEIEHKTKAVVEVKDNLLNS